MEIGAHFQQAARAWIDGDDARAVELAGQAVAEAPSDIAAWRLLARAREGIGDQSGALDAFEQALSLAPEDPSLLADVGALALGMGSAPLAEAFYRRALALAPNNLEAVDGLARALRNQHRYDEAIALLQPMVAAHPGEARLWNTVGTLLNQQGDSAKASIFFEEALRLDPGFAQALYNRGGVKLDVGDAAGALDDFDHALERVERGREAAMVAFARATALLTLGDLDRGWNAYEARFDTNFAQYLAFDIDVTRWAPDVPLQGRSLLVIAEQGLGDEIQFASLIGDAAKAIGPDGRLIIAVEPRLVALFQRSFAFAEVTAYDTRVEGVRRVRSVPALEHGEGLDLWIPLASLTRAFRRTISDFPDRSAYLTPDPSRTDHWRGALDGAGPGVKIGLTWRSGLLSGERRRLYALLTDWREVLTTPGARFVSLQYGDCDAEIAQARRELGVDIWRPSDIDIRENLDDLAALGCALDLTIGCENATTHLTASCGARTWIVSTPTWRRLGTAAYPWHPKVQAFNVPAFDAWSPALAQVAAQLRGFVG